MLTSELVYMIQDLLKNNSDDSFYTEEHILFLCKKFRSFLIKREQEKDRQSQETASEFETQQICLELELFPVIDGSPCTGGFYLKSTKPVPKIMKDSIPKVYPVDYFQGTYVSFVSRDRMRYVGSDKYLQNIIYAALGPDMHLYLNSANPQFKYLRKVRVSALFDDFEEASALSCDSDGTTVSCDILDMEFPIREYLVPALIDMVVRELSGTQYRREDTTNNASDDLPKENAVKQ